VDLIYMSADMSRCGLSADDARGKVRIPHLIVPKAIPAVFTLGFE
jgi:hypothetical protein